MRNRRRIFLHTREMVVQWFRLGAKLFKVCLGCEVSFLEWKAGEQRTGHNREERAIQEGMCRVRGACQAVFEDRRLTRESEEDAIMRAGGSGEDEGGGSIAADERGSRSSEDLDERSVTRSALRCHPEQSEP